MLSSDLLFVSQTFQRFLVFLTVSRIASEMDCCRSQSTLTPCNDPVKGLRWTNYVILDLDLGKKRGNVRFVPNVWEVETKRGEPELVQVIY